MAPEKIKRREGETHYTIKSDVWSFGLTMLEVSIGEYPYRIVRNCLVHIMNLIAEEDPPRLPSDPGLFTDEYRSFIAKCLVKDDKQRPTFQDLLEEPFITNDPLVDMKSFVSSILD